MGALQYHRAFSTLAFLYVSVGWREEALNLLNIYRGGVITLSALRVEERRARQ